MPSTEVEFGYKNEAQRKAWEDHLNQQQQDTAKGVYSSSPHLNKATSIANRRAGMFGDSYDKLAKQRKDLADDYTRRLESGELSYAEKQMQAGLGQAQRGAMAQAAAAGGALGQRAAMYGGQAAAGHAATQAAALRMQEMQAARQQQLGAYQALGRESLTGELGHAGRGLSASQHADALTLEMRKADELNTDQAFDRGLKVGGMAASALGAGMTGSDRSLKTGEIEASPANQDELIDNLKTYTFNYKDGTNLPKDRRIGVMAQDVRSAPLGRLMLREHGGALALDNSKALGGSLGLIGRLGERVKQLEAASGIEDRAQSDAMQRNAAISDALALSGSGALTEAEAQTMIDGMGADVDAERLASQARILARDYSGLGAMNSAERQAMIRRTSALDDLASQARILARDYGGQGVMGPAERQAMIRRTSADVDAERLGRKLAALDRETMAGVPRAVRPGGRPSVLEGVRASQYEPPANSIPLTSAERAQLARLSDDAPTIADATQVVSTEPIAASSRGGDREQIARSIDFAGDYDSQPIAFEGQTAQEEEDEDLAAFGRAFSRAGRAAQKGSPQQSGSSRDLLATPSQTFLEGLRR